MNTRKRKLRDSDFLSNGAQLPLLQLADKTLEKKIAFIPVDLGSQTQRERGLLESKYREAFEHRLDWRRLVTYVPNKELPIYNWFKYKEGFSRELVARLFKEFGLQEHDIVLDPFAGCGTTLLAAREFGLEGVGIDILPTSIFVTKAKLRNWPDLDLLLQSVQKLLAIPFQDPSGAFPNVRIINLAFSKETQRDILFFKEQIANFEQPIRDFLLLGLLSILEAVSKTSKDGQFLRLVDKPALAVRDALRSTLLKMISDLSEARIFGPPTRGKTVLLRGDAREMCLAQRFEGKVSAIITSPPYLNRYDYSRTYALELCLLTVKSHRDMVNLRHSLLRSHVESREHEGKQVFLPALDEILREMRSKPLNNERLPVMVQGYFEDMNLVIRNMAAYLKPGGHIALVVANAQFAGESVPHGLDAL